MMKTLILINSFVYEILMTSRDKYNISFLRDDDVPNGIRGKGDKIFINSQVMTLGLLENRSILVRNMEDSVRIIDQDLKIMTYLWA